MTSSSQQGPHEHHPQQTSETASGALQTGIRAISFEPMAEPVQRSARKVGVGSIAIAVALVVCAAVAWFVLTAKAVYLVTDPIEADIQLDSLLKLRLADRYLLRPGGRDASVSAPGYYTLNKRQVVRDEQSQDYSFALKRLPGHLKVDS